MSRQSETSWSDGGKFRVGNSVHLKLGERKVPATVIENRGPLGSEGRYVYRISVEPRYWELREGEPTILELVEDDLRLGSVAEIKSKRKRVGVG